MYSLKVNIQSSLQKFLSFWTKIVHENHSALAALFISISSGIFVTRFTTPSAPGGSWHFPALADWIGGSKLPSAQPLEVRDLGYPLFLWLTGGNHIVFYQSVFACLIPFLVYKSVAYFSPLSGWISLVLVILSLSPYQFVGWLHHDQIFIFFLVLSCYLTIKFITDKSKTTLFLATSSWVFTSITRPAASLSAFLVFIAIFVFSKNQRKMIAVSILVTTFFSISYSTYRNHEIKSLSGVDYSKIQLFFAGYVVNGGGSNGARINNLQTEAGDELNFRILKGAQLLRQNPEVIETWLLGQGYSQDEIPMIFPFLKDSPSEIAEFLIEHPTQDNLEFIQNLIGNQVDLLGKVGRDLILNKPLNYLNSVSSNMMKYSFDPGWVYARHLDPLGSSQVKGAWQFIFLGRNTAVAQLSSLPKNVENQFDANETARSVKLGSQLTTPGIIKIAANQSILNLHEKFIHIFCIILSLFSLLTLIVLRQKSRDESRLALFVLSVGYLQLMFVTSAAVGPDYRYVTMTMPMLAILFGLSLSIVKNKFRYVKVKLDE